MSKKRDLFEAESDEDAGNSGFTINKNYAQRYEEWREAEIKRKLEDKYGSADLSVSSSSSDDDDEPEELEQVLSKDFFEVISSLKTKDPKIYNPEIKFFKNEEGADPVEKKKQKKGEKEKPVYLRDYERKLITERGGQLSDDESDVEGDEHAARAQSPSYAEEQRLLKESLSKALQDDDSDEDDGLLKKKEKTKAEKTKEEEDYIAWLRGEKQDLADNETKEALKPLQKLWNDPSLDEGEKFLRDYVLNKRFLEKDSEPVDPGNLSDDALQEEYMNTFERKYNFRFEEPDREFLKRYPRTMEQSMRKKDTKRKEQREAVKKRKDEEKKRKKEELKVLKALKRKEILQKIEKIKQITGNDQLGIDPDELEEDFDPEAHDRRMKEMFNDDYYEGADDEAELDELNLPPLEEELQDDVENWDEWDGTDRNGKAEVEDGTEESGQDNYTPHCEDPDFVMDCDYDPASAAAQEISGRRSAREKRKLKRQSRFGRLVRKEKPVFDPNDKTFQEYVDEYYGMDYEDLIGDIPCRFKYRKVAPNNFGLTIEEILAADDKELNQWASIKKTYTIRPEHVEVYEQKAYDRKAQDEELKRKILPSLFRQNESTQNSEVKKKKKKKNKTAGQDTDTVNLTDECDSIHVEVNAEASESNVMTDESNEKKDKKKKRKNKKGEIREEDVSEAFSETVKTKKGKERKFELADDGEINDDEGRDTLVTGKNNKGSENKCNGETSYLVKEEPVKGGPSQGKKKGQKKEPIANSEFSSADQPNQNKKRKFSQIVENTPKNAGKKRKSWGSGDHRQKSKSWKKKGGQSEGQTDLSDARLKAYGLHPKKFKNKLKYGNKNFNQTV